MPTRTAEKQMGDSEGDKSVDERSDDEFLWIDSDETIESETVDDESATDGDESTATVARQSSATDEQPLVTTGESAPSSGVFGRLRSTVGQLF